MAKAPSGYLGPVTMHVKMSRRSFSHPSIPPSIHLPSSSTYAALVLVLLNMRPEGFWRRRPGRMPVRSGGNKRDAGGKYLYLCMCVILLRVSGVAELSRTNPKMNNDGKGDDIWVELLPVQLVNPDRARFLQGKEGGTMSRYKFKHVSIQVFSHLFNVTFTTKKRVLKVWVISKATVQPSYIIRHLQPTFGL